MAPTSLDETLRRLVSRERDGMTLESVRECHFRESKGTIACALGRLVALGAVQFDPELSLYTTRTGPLCARCGLPAPLDILCECDACARRIGN